MFSECRGLGQPIGEEESLKLAQALKERYILEIEESLKLVSNYRDFRRGSASREGHVIVHDSRGEHMIRWEDLPGMLSFLLGEKTP